LKRIVLRSTAVNSFTGTLTSPKLIAPVQIGRGMEQLFRRACLGPCRGHDSLRWTAPEEHAVREDEVAHGERHPERPPDEADLERVASGRGVVDRQPEG